MEKTTIMCGIGAGMVAGMLVGAMLPARPQSRKTMVGQAMQRMGNAVDTALDTVGEKMK